MEATDFGILVVIAVLGFACYSTKEASLTERARSMGDVIVACAASCDGLMLEVSPSSCECQP